MLSSIVRFADDAAALEKTLRLCQYLCHAALGLTSFSQNASVLQAHAQLALGRRYFRLLKWHPSWALASESLNRDRAPLEKLIDVTKWSFLGLYFFLEMFTITNAMQVTNHEFGPTLQQEANKCWLYSIAASIVLSLYQLLQHVLATPATEPVKREKAKPGDSENPPEAAVTGNAKTSPYAKLYTQLIIDCCDILIPAAGLGWLRVDPVIVGTAGSISSLLAGQQIWSRVQAAAG